MAFGNLTITLSRAGSFRAGRHGDYDAHSQAFDIAGGVDRGGGAGIGSVWRRLPGGMWHGGIRASHDGVSNVKVAYSTRKLRTAYAGFAMRVQETTGSTTQDIGFTAG